MKTVFIFFVAAILFQFASAQELQAKFTIVSNKVGTQIDKKIFQTLQTSLTNF